MEERWVSSHRSSVFLLLCAVPPAGVAAHIARVRSHVDRAQSFPLTREDETAFVVRAERGGDPRTVTAFGGCGAAAAAPPSRSSSDWLALTWEAFWPFMSAPDILQMRVTFHEFSDTKKYGLHGELFSFLLRRETSPMEAARPRHEHLMFFSFSRPEGLLLPAGKDPLSQDAIGGIPWL